MDASIAPEKRLSLRKKLLFSAVMALLCLGMAEGALRIAWDRPEQFVGERLAETDLFVQDPLLGWKARPDQDLEFAFSAARKVRIRTNGAGFRDRERTLEGDPGRLRVLVLGDSFTFGYGVDQDECFTAHLAERIPEAEILNLGVTGYNVAQARALFESEGAAYRPDLVLFAFVQNDVCAQLIPTARSHQKRRQGGGIKAAICRASYLADFVRDRVTRHKGLSSFLIRVGLKKRYAGYDQLDLNLRPSLRTYPPDLGAEWEATLAELQLLHRSCSEREAALVVVLVPGREAVEPGALERTIAYVDYGRDDFDLDRPYRALREALGGWSVPVIDPRSRFRSAAESKRELYLPLDMHLTAEGHRLLASEIAPHLRAALALPSR